MSWNDYFEYDDHPTDFHELKCFLSVLHIENCWVLVFHSCPEQQGSRTCFYIDRPDPSTKLVSRIEKKQKILQSLFDTGRGKVFCRELLRFEWNYFGLLNRLNNTPWTPKNRHKLSDRDGSTKEVVFGMFENFVLSRTKRYFIPGEHIKNWRQRYFILKDNGQVRRVSF